MVAKQKIEKVCKELESLGYPKTKVRAKLLELLELYDSKWELIEDNDYLVLIDALLLEKPDEIQRVKSKRKISAGCMSRASKPGAKRLYTKKKKRKASSAHYSNASSVRISVENKEEDVISLSSDAHNHSGAEEFETSRRSARLREKQKASASLTNFLKQKQKASASGTNSPKQLAVAAYQIKDEPASWYENASESEEFEIPLIRSGRKRRKGSLDEAEFPHSGNEEVAESIQLHAGDEGINLSSASLSDHALYKRMKAGSFQTCSTAEKIDSSQHYTGYGNVKSPISLHAAPETSMVCYASPKAVLCMNWNPSNNLLDPPFSVPDIPFLECKDSYSNGNDSEAKTDDSESMSTRSIDVEGRDLPNQLCDISSSHENNANVNADKLKIMDLDSVYLEDKGDSFLKSQFTVASSPKGEVKLCLICNTFEQSDICASSFDNVVELVEEECRKSCGIKEPNFSLRKLMKELCERLLEVSAVSVSTADENYVLPVQNILSKVHDATDASQLDLLIPSASFNGSVIFQNLIELAPQISRHVTVDGLYFLRVVIGFKMECIKNICIASGKKLKVLERTKTKSSSNEAGQKHHLLSDVIEPYAYLDDITRGKENIKIPFVRGSNPEDLPAFSYIAQNMVYDKAFVKFTLSSISDEDCCLLCSGDCLTSAIPCACARETGGQFAYASTGLVKERFLKECISLDEDPNKDRCISFMACPAETSKNNVSSCCKGHVIRKFIKECWSKCGCSKNCGNRVVQRGITRNLQVFWTPEGKGWGLQTVESLPRGAFVCEYVGEIVTFSEFRERNMQDTNCQSRHPVPLDAAWGLENVLKDEEALFLDATNYGNIGRFINHRCSDANLIQIPVEVETTSHHYYHVAFFTKREVAAMEELTWDYGIDFNDAKAKNFKCLCGSPVCRDPSYWN